MRLDFAHHHLSRRDALKLGAASTVAAAIHPGSVNAAPEAASGRDRRPKRRRYSDEMFDVARVAAGGFWVSPYGRGDQSGTWNEVTPRRTAQALQLLDRSRPVRTYQLGEELFNGFPAFPSAPPRLHDMFLYVLGYDAGPDFVAGGGIQASTTPIGPNKVVVHEERFAANYTFQIATQIDGLAHVGIATGDARRGWFYNDNYAADLITPTGTTRLGNETTGPIVTRGVIIDVVGLKVAARATADFFIGPNRKPVLRDNYRVTIDDIERCLRRQRIHRPIGAGDVPILHTGWTHLVRSDPRRYLAQEPGIYLAEARYLADRRVAIAASDAWGLEVLDPAVTGGNAFPCHQELLGKTGVRIGEGFVTDAPIADRCYEGVFIVTPQNVPGATCGSTPPAFLAQPGRRPHDDD